jgi:hypothetical protein
MNKEIAKKWITELRSGKYKQGTGRLHGTDADGSDRYCCLGVLCEIAVSEGVAERSSEPIRHGRYMYGTEVNERKDFEDKTRHSTVLPVVVKEWAGMKDDCGKHNVSNGGYEYLTSLNDRGSSFAQIADIIEQNVEQL